MADQQDFFALDKRDIVLVKVGTICAYVTSNPAPNTTWRASHSQDGCRHDRHRQQQSTFFSHFIQPALPQGILTCVCSPKLS